MIEIRCLHITPYSRKLGGFLQAKFSIDASAANLLKSFREAEHMYNIILFDLDGTLTDPGLGITNSAAHALRYWGIEVEDRASLYKFIGPPLQDSFQTYYGFSESDSKLAIERFREYFRDRGIFENEPYPGIDSLLKALRDSGKTIILATSKPEEFAKTILKHFHLEQYFHHIAGASMDETRCKKADVITYALEHCGITDLSDAVMIGDREHDILGAKQVGMDSIGVLYGYGSREELEQAGATYIAEQVSDLISLIDKG